MKAHTLIQVSAMILLAILVSIAVLALVYALQAPNLLATVS